MYSVGNTIQYLFYYCKRNSIKAFTERVVKAFLSKTESQSHEGICGKNVPSCGLCQEAEVISIEFSIAFIPVALTSCIRYLWYYICPYGR